MATLRFFRNTALIDGRDFTPVEFKEQLNDYLIHDFYEVRFRNDSVNDVIIYRNVHRDFIPEFVAHTHPEFRYILLHATKKGVFIK